MTQTTTHVLTTTKEQTMRVHVLGPNLRDQSKGSFHVHAEGCADVKRSREYKGRDFDHDRRTTYEVSSLVDVAAEIYQDMIDEDNPAENYVSEFYVFPCASDLPDEDPDKAAAEEILEAVFSPGIGVGAAESPAKAPESRTQLRFRVTCAFGSSPTFDWLPAAETQLSYMNSICLGHHQIEKV